MRSPGVSPEPAVDLIIYPNPPLCAESVTGKLRNTSTPAPEPSPVDLRTLLVHNSTGLAMWAEIVVLCRFLDGCDGARSLSFPSAVKRADANQGCCRS